MPAERLQAIATELEKATEPAFPEVARRLSVELVACTVTDLDRVAGQVLTPSKFVLKAKGLPSIAEASAHRRRRPQCPPAGRTRRHRARDLRHRHGRGPMTVHFIGAGPGAPDLITVRGRDLIARCPVCLYAGSLVPKALLEHCPPGARIVDTAPMSLDEIVEECKRATADGHDVARLHSGDLSVWSAMGEQLRRLDEAGIAYTVTPGVPSFAAAAAALGQELTLPEVAQSVVLTRTSGRASAMPPAETLEAFAATGATLAIHLSIHILDKVVADVAAALRRRLSGRRGLSRELARGARDPRHAGHACRRSGQDSHRAHGADPGRQGAAGARLPRQRALRRLLPTTFPGPRKERT